MIGQALHALGVCNIELDRKRIVAHFSGELAKGFRIAIYQYDPAPALEQRPGNGAAHATGRTRHHGVSEWCFSHWISPLWFDGLRSCDGPASIDWQRRACDVLCGLA